MTRDALTYAFIGDLIKSRDDKGFLHIKGLASDDTLDLDGQICDPAWLGEAMGQWFKTGNIREMHQLSAVGTATAMTQKGTGFEIEAKIVDPVAALKFDEGVYTGLSIGIKGARIDRSKDALKRAPEGVIVGGRIVEISGVDLPANPSAVLELVKTVGGVTDKTEVLGEIDDEDLSKADAYKPTPYKKDADETIQCPKCERFNDTDAHFCDQCGFKLDGSTDVSMKSVEADDEILTKADEPDEVVEPVEPVTPVVPEVTEPIETETTEHGDDDTMAYIALGVSPDLVKRVNSAEVTDEDKTEFRAEIVKALGLEEIATKAELSELREANESLKAALNDVREMAAPGQPALRAMFDQQSKAAEADELESKAMKFKATAMNSTDKGTAAQYMSAAAEMNKQAAALRAHN